MFDDKHQRLNENGDSSGFSRMGRGDTMGTLFLLCLFTFPAYFCVFVRSVEWMETRCHRSVTCYNR
jgi:hypothetical protein